MSLAHLFQKFGNFEDMRKAAPNTIKQLEDKLGLLQDSIGEHIASQAKQLHEDTKFAPAHVKAIYDNGYENIIKNYGPKAKAEHQSSNQSPQKMAAPKKAKASVHDEAVNWARSNPNDPRSAAILKKNGVR